MKADDRAPWAIGFESLRDEVSLDALPLRGALPDWLDGALVRTTPALYEAGADRLNHWFDGFAMLYRFAFRDGRVGYANRLLASRAFIEAQRRGALSRGEFATSPRRNWVERARDWFHPRLTDNANVNVDRLGGDLVAYTETPLPLRFDLLMLETLGPFDYGDRVEGQLSTPHPHFDAARGLHYNLVLKFGRKSRYQFVAVDARSARAEIVGSVATDRPAYTHSFAMTERYLVLAEFPLVVNPLRLKFSSAPFIRNYRWQPQRGTRLHVVEKASGRVVRSAQATPMFAFHHVNAFEAGDDIVLDFVRYDDARVIDELVLERLRRAGSRFTLGRPTRLRIGPRGDAREEPLPAVALEFPRIDKRRRADARYRFIYGAASETPGAFFDRLVKCDLDRGAQTVWQQPGCHPGEPLFVAAPQARGEDRGVVLSVVLDARAARSFLLTLDAERFAEIARADLPHAMPFGFHGSYVANDIGGSRTAVTNPS